MARLPQLPPGGRPDPRPMVDVEGPRRLRGLIAAHYQASRTQPMVDLFLAAFVALHTNRPV